jgi:NosR/NirI family nitrous oxide reductase transcriptional regulator
MREELVRPAWGACLIMLLAWLLAALVSHGHASAADLDRFVGQVPVGELVPGADSLGPVRPDLPVAPALAGGKPVGWVFLNSDFAPSTGYSGKPINILIGLGQDARITGAKLVKHYEPIVLVGIPEKRITDVIGRYVGLDMAKEAATSGEGHKLDIVSGATVTIMVIDDSIVRAGIKVARALGLGGLKAEVATSGPKREIDTGKVEIKDWLTLVGDGSLRRLTLDVGMVNDGFARSGDPRAAERPEPGEPSETFVDLYAAVVSIPTIGKSLLGDAEYRNRLEKLVAEGRQAILVAGRGRYSWKGSGYVRGGLFDRVQLIQGDHSVRFHDRDHGRLGGIAAEGAPDLKEVGLFVLPKDASFDPAQPWRLQLLVQRATGPTDKAFLTYDLNYEAPAAYFKEVAPAPAPATTEAAAAPVGEAHFAGAPKLWERIWRDRLPEVAFLGLLLAMLTGTFFFQNLLVRHERLVQRFRTGFLVVVLVWLGWYANAQLSVVNVMTFGNALLTGFSWDYFLMDPLVFTLWFAVAAALIFWGRGAYCGWLCPFGALQELTNKVAKRLKVPQWQVPWGLHERLWPIKYIIFLVLFGISLYSLDTAERLAEIEPFKTAIILKFWRAWPFVLFAVGLLVAGLFVERFYCRYLCPLGAALAIPARLRSFDWLKRYRDCGNPCQRCSNECMVQAIHPEGHINPNECLNCLHCQTLYVSDTKCPVCIQKRLKKERRKAVLGDSPARPVLPKPKPAAPKPAAAPAE